MRGSETDKMKINSKITKCNRTLRNGKKNEWVVIHYVGAVSTAKNNAQYFYDKYRGASAHYFVDENEIWQVVEEKDNAWHVGGAKKYFNDCRNSNSIGIELCCKKDAKGWYFEPQTIENAVELTATIMLKYNLDIFHLTTHNLTTGKICPAPFVKHPEQWVDFKKKVLKKMEELKMAFGENEVPTETEKELEIMKYFGFDSITISYFRMYKFGSQLIDKLYYKAKNAEK